MGVLPLEFKAGDNRNSYAIDGTETYDVIGNGETVEIPVACRLDTMEEVQVYGAGGVLQCFAQDFLEANG